MIIDKFEIEARAKLLPHPDKINMRRVRLTLGVYYIMLQPNFALKLYDKQKDMISDFNTIIAAWKRMK